MTGCGKHLVVALAGALSVLLQVAPAGCGNEPSDTGTTHDPELVEPAASGPGAPRGVANPLQRRLSMRQEIRARLPAALTDLLLERVWDDALYRALSRDNVANLPPYRIEFFAPVYAEAGRRPVFVELAGGLADRARVLLNELRAAHQHALDPTPYRLGDLDRLERALAESPPLAFDWPLDADAVAALDASLDALLEPSVEGLAPIAAGLEGEAPVPQLAELFEERVQQARQALRDDLEFELVAAHAFLSYAFDMKIFNLNRMSLEQLAAAGGQREVQRQRLREAFLAAAGATTEEFAAQLEALYPPHEQYPRLMTSLARYRDIVESGGWPHVRSRDLRRGTSNPRVRELKQRLAIEGFYDGPIDNTYDDALVEAVRSYQESHQMQVTGEPHDMFWRSLNTPADRRLAQIELTLQRWRETRMRGEDYYVFVNIPDFHVEVWRHGERQLRLRIVAGNTDQACNPVTGRMEYVNATPLQNAEIEYLVFNPYWNVPPRIRQDELDLELMQNPAWLQENRYEVVVAPGGPRIRQLPGPDNALGAVKFIFPNIHNTYMHDTPHQRYFDFPIRNYSHGCMRVQNPMSYAEVLLMNDGQWDPERIQRIRDSGIETTLHLNEHVPIFIEYYVVRVDELGRTHFLSDIYRYDRMLLEGWEPEACTVPQPVAGTAVPEPTVQWNNDGTAVIPDGTVIHPDGRIDFSQARLAATPGRGDARGDGAQGDGSRELRRRGLEHDPESGQPDPGDIGP